MVTLTDQLGRIVSMPCFPQRIISTVPSQTELLYHLGLDHEIAGVTKFCTRPNHKVKGTLKIGGTKQLDIPLIKLLKPDLIIANKEENDQQQLEELMAVYPMYISDPFDLTGALVMVSDAGVLTGHKPQADNLIKNITAQFNRLKELQLPALRVAYLIWQNPCMVAGKNTFIDDVLYHCGFENVFKQERYPQITMDTLAAYQPDVVLLSSEPYPFKQKHADEFAAMLPGCIIKLVDGELFSWYGSRLLHAPEYFITLTYSIKQALNTK